MVGVTVLAEAFDLKFNLVRACMVDNGTVPLILLAVEPLRVRLPLEIIRQWAVPRRGHVRYGATNLPARWRRLRPRAQGDAPAGRRPDQDPATSCERSILAGTSFLGGSDPEQRGAAIARIDAIERDARVLDLMSN
jgi:hypothetical protein